MSDHVEYAKQNSEKGRKKKRLERNLGKEGSYSGINGCFSVSVLVH